MGNESVLSRRRFLILSMIGAGGLCVFSQCIKPVPSAWRFLSNEEVRMLNALVEQIIPADVWPGAYEAGATNYIDKQLVGPYVRFQENYREGLRSLQEYSVFKYQKNYEQLEWDVQTQILEKLEDGELDSEFGEKISGRQFFNMLCDHTMQSFYGSQRHGGNKGNISYKMLKLDYPLIIGQNRYNG